MIIDELFEGPQLCPECGGISFSDLILAEKKDACYYKVKASAKVWPSAYASGRLVQCRKKGAANYGKSKTESVAEGLDDIEDTRQFRNAIALAKSQKAIRQAKDGKDVKYYADGTKVTPAEVARRAAERKAKKQGVAEATGDEKFDTMMGRIQHEPKYPDPQMPPTDVKDLYQWAVKNNKPYHKIFAEWANREGFKSVAPALHKAGTLDSDALDYWTPDVWKTYWGEVRGIDSEMPPEWAKQRIPDELRDYLETVFDAYDHIVFDWPTEYRQIGQQGMAEQQELDEKWSQKYKNSINCANPKGFSQRAHCAGRKKNEDVAEANLPGARRDPYLEPNDISGTHQPQFNVPLIPDYAPGGARMPMASSPKWTSTKIPGVSLHTGPPPKVTVQKRGAEYEPLASEVPAYVRQGKPDPVTLPVGKPKITVRPGETQSQAIQRTQTEKEFGQFLQGQSGQTFGAGAGRGTVNPPTAKSTGSASEMEKIMKKWDQEQSSSGDPRFSGNYPSRKLNVDSTDVDEDASRKKREQPEVDYDDDYDAMVARVKKLAGLGPMKTVYDPTKRVYRNMPTAVQPKK